jgi:hypothetical protein
MLMMFIVAMGMLVFGFVMFMLMLMRFCEMKEDTKAHERGRYDELTRQRFLPEKDCTQGPNKWRT